MSRSFLTPDGIDVADGLLKGDRWSGTITYKGQELGTGGGDTTALQAEFDAHVADSTAHGYDLGTFITGPDATSYADSAIAAHADATTAHGFDLATFATNANLTQVGNDATSYTNTAIASLSTGADATAYTNAVIGTHESTWDHDAFITSALNRYLVVYADVNAGTTEFATDTTFSDINQVTVTLNGMELLPNAEFVDSTASPGAAIILAAPTVAGDDLIITVWNDGAGGSGGGSGGGHIIEDEGTPLTQRDTLNFVGSGVTVTDTGSKTLVTIATATVDTTGIATDAVTASTTNGDLTLSGNGTGDVVVNGKLIADEIELTGTGALAFASGSNITFTAADAVIIGDGVFRLKSYTTTERNLLTPTAGDSLFNSTAGEFQGWNGSAWVTLG